VAGAALSGLGSAWVRNLLYGVQPFDPATDIALILSFIAIVSGAAALPALRAIRVDPASTLRRE